MVICMQKKLYSFGVDLQKVWTTGNVKVKTAFTRSARAVLHHRGISMSAYTTGSIFNPFFPVFNNNRLVIGKSSLHIEVPEKLLK